MKKRQERITQREDQMEDELSGISDVEWGEQKEERREEEERPDRQQVQENPEERMEEI